MNRSLVVQQRSVEELIDRNLLTHQRGIDEIMDRFRNTVITRALELNKGNISETAKMLKTNRTTLVRWMDEFGMRDQDAPIEGLENQDRSA
jgi:DNA-binding NtrC family response regulator